MGRDEHRARRFQRLFDAHYRRVLAYALRRTRSEADAQDAVADAFAVAWRRLESVPEARAGLPWLYGATRRCLANQRRQRARGSRLAERLGEQPVADEATDAEEGGDRAARAVRSALERLRPADREILRLVAWEELSHGEVAAALGVSPNAVAIRLHRARKRLERVLVSEGLLEPGAEEA